MLPKVFTEVLEISFVWNNSWTYALHNIRSSYSILYTFAKTFKVISDKNSEGNIVNDHF